MQFYAVLCVRLTWVQGVVSVRVCTKTCPMHTFHCIPVDSVVHQHSLMWACVSGDYMYSQVALVNVGGLR